MLYRQGQSGNPAGRPRGSGRLETQVRRRFQGDPGALIGSLALIATGGPEEVERQLGIRPQLSDRVLAIEVLLQSGWKSKAKPEGSGADER